MSWRSDGIRSWLIQRISAIFIFLFLIYLSLFFLQSEHLDYATWSAWVSLKANKVIILLFFISLLLHAWVGIRDVVLDYVHAFTIRFIVLTTIIGALLSLAVWLLLIIIKVQ